MSGRCRRAGLLFRLGCKLGLRLPPSRHWDSSRPHSTAFRGTQLNATATNPNDGSAVTGALTYNPAGTTVLHAGNGQTLRADFTPNGADASSYNTPAQKTVSINVLKATLTVTADNKSRAFGVANPTLTFTPTGFVNGDTSTVLSVTPT